MFEWDYKYSVGNDYIDNQHKVILKLIDVIQNHAEILDQDGEKQVVGKALDRLIHYAEIHFADEEEILSHHNYGGLKRHMEIHRNLLVQSYKLRDKYNEVGAAILPTIAEFLREWLLTHILGVDMKYKPFVGTNEKPQVGKLRKLRAEDMYAFLEEEGLLSKQAQKEMDQTEAKTDQQITKAPKQIELERNIKKALGKGDFSKLWDLDGTYFVKEDATIDQCIRIMKTHDLTNVLVLNSSEDVIAIVTESDIVRRYASVQVADKTNRRINAIGSRPVAFVRISHIKEDIQNILSKKSIRNFPIVDGDTLNRKSIVGFMTISDVASLGLIENKKIV